MHEERLTQLAAVQLMFTSAMTASTFDFNTAETLLGQSVQMAGRFGGVSMSMEQSGHNKHRRSLHRIYTSCNCGFKKSKCTFHRKELPAEKETYFRLSFTMLSALAETDGSAISK